LKISVQKGLCMQRLIGRAQHQSEPKTEAKPVCARWVGWSGSFHKIFNARVTMKCLGAAPDHLFG